MPMAIDDLNAATELLDKFLRTIETGREKFLGDVCNWWGDQIRKAGRSNNEPVREPESNPSPCDAVAETKQAARLKSLNDILAVAECCVRRDAVMLDDELRKQISALESLVETRKKDIEDDARCRAIVDVSIPESGTLTQTRAQLLQLGGRHKEAIQHFSRADNIYQNDLQGHPSAVRRCECLRNSIECQCMLALSHAKMGHFKKAVAIAKRALECSLSVDEVADRAMWGRFGLVKREWIHPRSFAIFACMEVYADQFVRKPKSFGKQRALEFRSLLVEAEVKFGAPKSWWPDMKIAALSHPGMRVLLDDFVTSIAQDLYVAMGANKMFRLFRMATVWRGGFVLLKGQKAPAKVAASVAAVLLLSATDPTMEIDSAAMKDPNPSVETSVTGGVRGAVRIVLGPDWETKKIEDHAKVVVDELMNQPTRERVPNTSMVGVKGGGGDV
jgi:tetratricopeptide (TPR) repeat protein